MQGSRPSVSNTALRCWFANVFGALALALLAVAHVLPVLHFTLVAHELCAEHGALHHVEAGRGGGATRPSLASRAQGFTASADAAHEHEHCGVLSTKVERSLLPTRVEAGARTCSSVYRIERLEASDARPNLALLDYAPKLAPPV